MTQNIHAEICSLLEKVGTTIDNVARIEIIPTEMTVEEVFITTGTDGQQSIERRKSRYQVGTHKQGGD